MSENLDARAVTANPAGPLTGRCAVPGDKSISHRAVLLGALAVGETTIRGLLEGEDVLRTIAAIRALGAEAEKNAEGVWRIWGVGVGGLAEPDDVLDMGHSGTAARRLLGVLALLAEQFGEACSEGTLIDVRITHAQLAAAIGATRATVTRLLGPLRRNGLVLTVQSAAGERFCLPQWQGGHGLEVGRRLAVGGR